MLKVCEGGMHAVQVSIIEAVAGDCNLKNVCRLLHIIACNWIAS